MKKVTALLAATFITASCGLAMAQGAGMGGGGGGGGAAGATGSGAGGEPPRRSDANPPGAVRQQLPSTVRGDAMATDPGAMRSGSVSATPNRNSSSAPRITTKRSD